LLHEHALPTPPPTARRQLNAIKGKREAVNAELDALRSKETEARSDVPALIAERKEISEIITKLREKQGEIRDAFNAKWQVRAAVAGSCCGRAVGARCAPGSCARCLV
jgi:predicted  nucleic acid-binding Zn-ribbon protein